MLIATFHKGNFLVDVIVQGSTIKASTAKHVTLECMETMHERDLHERDLHDVSRQSKAAHAGFMESKRRFRCR